MKTGDRYGRWVVLDAVPLLKGPRRRVVCKCSCGTEREVDYYALISGHSRSCGCFKVDRAIETNTIHGQSRSVSGERESRAYSSWLRMRSRVLNEGNNRFYRYGARGITCDPRWLESFEEFFKDMGPCPVGHSIERENNDEGYSKENCSWATPKEQARNRSTSRFLTHEGLRLTCAGWAELRGMTTFTLSRRLNSLGWSVPKALDTPVKGRQGNQITDLATKEKLMTTAKKGKGGKGGGGKKCIGGA